tara:strand:+ start:8443 stop:10503 length:2061 start_codon:yes stop_codon:yes gene_type:complete
MAQYTFDAQLKTQIAKNFISDFQPFGKNRVYVGVGQVYDPGSLAPLEKRSVERDLVTRRNISFARRVAPSDVTMMIPRVNWSNGITMSPLDTSDDMSETFNESTGTTAPFYVVTNSDNVYVCLENGVGDGGLTGSVYEPIGTDTSPITLPDGFKWKYMYTIPGTHLKFKDEKQIPVVSLPYYEGIFNVYNDERQRQYAVQYEANLDAASGIVDGVAITSNPSTAIFERGVPDNINNEVEFSTNNTVMITQPNLAGTAIEDYYKDYHIRFISGQAAGVVRKITASATNGDAQDILTLDSDFDTNRSPQNKDRFEIGVGITITGNGQNAAAFGSLDSDKRLRQTVVYNKGTGYSDASAVVFTGGVGDDAFPSDLPTLDPLISQSIGKDPVFELFSNIARVQVSIPGDGENNVEQLLGNDYRDVALWVNPEIEKGQTGEGNIAGYRDRVRTRVDISGSTGSIAELVNPARFVGETKFLYGTDTKEFVEVVGQPSKTSTLSASAQVRDMSKPFVRDENLTLLRTTEDGNFTATSLTGDFKVVNTYYEDSSLEIEKLDWRCTHKLRVDFGEDGDYVPTLDGGATGSSGSNGIITAVLPYDETGGAIFDASINKRIVLLTDVSNVSGSTHGFVENETLTYLVGNNPVSGSIENVEGPELDLFSGELLYIKGLTQEISRVVEQTDVFRFTFEF